MHIMPDFNTANSSQIEASLCERLSEIRLSRNLTQAQLAKQAGVSLRTINRLEKGQGVSLDTFIRVMMALGIQQNLEALLPDPSVRPMERINRSQKERRRAWTAVKKTKKPTPPESGDWSWGDGKK